MTANDINVDLVNINAHIKFGEILSICSQDIERTQNLGANQLRAITLVKMCEK